MDDLPRTRTEALLDLRYQVRLHFLHARLFRRLRAASALLALVAGSAALVTALQGRPQVMAALGALVALASFADLVLGWADRAARHELWREQLASLVARSGPMSLKEIDAGTAQVTAEIDDEIESLRVPAFNDVARSNGHEDWVRPESVAERLVRAIA